MRTFEHFPQDIICILCRTNDDKPCILIPIDGTEDGWNCEAEPVHVDCMLIGFRYLKEAGVVYRRTE